MNSGILYIIAAIIALLLGFVWNLWQFAWLPVLIAVIIDMVMRNNQKNDQ